ncbi:MAG: hypothetical protein V4595_04680 [Pseudomonadota bacterium]
MAVVVHVDGGVQTADIAYALALLFNATNRTSKAGCAPLQLFNAMKGRRESVRRLRSQTYLSQEVMLRHTRCRQESLNDKKADGAYRLYRRHSATQPTAGQWALSARGT